MSHHLPPEIQRTSLFYESCDLKDFNNETAFLYLDAIPERFRLSSQLGETLDWSVCWDTNYLSGSYLSRAGSPSSPKELRTALIAIDSKGRSSNEPEWAEMLPDFRRTYEQIVGLCYLGDLRSSKSSYFSRRARRRPGHPEVRRYNQISLGLPSAIAIRCNSQPAGRDHDADRL
jgi:hypothetical protein